MSLSYLTDLVLRLQQSRQSSFPMRLAPPSCSARSRAQWYAHPSFDLGSELLDSNVKKGGTKGRKASVLKEAIGWIERLSQLHGPVLRILPRMATLHTQLLQTKQNKYIIFDFLLLFTLRMPLWLTYVVLLPQPLVTGRETRSQT